MTVIALALTLMTLTDGACSGLRAGLGRTGLINHKAIDRRGAAVGTAIAALILIPCTAISLHDLATDEHAASAYLRAGHVMLTVFIPFAVVVLAALAAYATLNWRKKYLAMAVILGPCTFARPIVAGAAAIAGAAVSDRVETTVAIAVATIGLLCIEPLMGMRWNIRTMKSPV